MTREQYEKAIKYIMETATKLLETAKSDKERTDIMMAENLQIQSIVRMYSEDVAR